MQLALLAFCVPVFAGACFLLGFALGSRQPPVTHVHFWIQRQGGGESEEVDPSDYWKFGKGSGPEPEGGE